MECDGESEPARERECVCVCEREGGERERRGGERRERREERGERREERGETREERGERERGEREQKGETTSHAARSATRLLPTFDRHWCPSTTCRERQRVHDSGVGV